MNVPWSRLRRELWRKLIHLTTGLVPLAYAAGVPKPWIAGLLGVFLVCMIVIEIARRGENLLGKLFREWFNFMLRAREVRGDTLLGATPYCFASLVSILVLPKPIAVLALLYLAVGDTAASLVGLGWGRHRVGSKSWEGFVAFWAATSAVALAMHALLPGYPLVGALLASPAAGLAELLLVRYDDNIVIPLAAGLVMLLCAAAGVG